jgi:hypothetical protein
MSKNFGFGFSNGLKLLLVATLLFWGVARQAIADAEGSPAASLRAKYIELTPELISNQFKRPIHLDSTDLSNQLIGDIYAVVDAPFADFNRALIEPPHWCDVLILHLNTKYCNASTTGEKKSLLLRIGKKSTDSLSQAYALEFAYSATSATADYFNAKLTAERGPLGTSNYKIQLEAVPVQGGKTFLHLTYSYAYNLVGRLAMQGYLATAGSGKVGFTRVNDSSGGEVRYIDGMRGVVERNTMRYYLAIETYMGALSTAPAGQVEKRLQTWFSATELYPRQLHEIDRSTYLNMKRNEILRMQKSP